jgi:thiosulfate/3-mercaptopyruvate sulfurtransferase
MEICTADKGHMDYQTLISTSELAEHMDDPNWVILDCRFSLADTEKGRRDYLEAHIPSARYAHLDDDLSGLKIPGVTGRHPLPAVEAAARTFANCGISSDIQVVCYDNAGGALAAARAWWMLRWLGHDAAAVLDGGWQKWIAEGRPRRAGVESRPLNAFIARPHPQKIATTGQVEELSLAQDGRLFDARAVERFHGQNETIDPVAGHIPGAVSAPYFDNLNPDLTFRTTEELRTHYLRLLGKTSAGEAVFYCGSGVTSIHNILAMLHAGLGEARLYVGSWSEWVTNHQRRVEV